MNDVKLTGNLTRDPEIRSVGNGATVANFTVATSRNYKKKDGTYGKETAFVDCEAWDSGAVKVGETLSKGSSVLVSGLLKSDSWEDTEGNKRSKLKLRVGFFVELKGFEKDLESEVEPTKTATQTATKAKSKAAAKKETVSVGVDNSADDAPVDEDLPF